MPVVTHGDCILSNSEFFSKVVNDNNYCAGFRNGINNHAHLPFTTKQIFKLQAPPHATETPAAACSLRNHWRVAWTRSGTSADWSPLGWRCRDSTFATTNSTSCSPTWPSTWSGSTVLRKNELFLFTYLLSYSSIILKLWTSVNKRSVPSVSCSLGLGGPPSWTCVSCSRGVSLSCSRRVWGSAHGLCFWWRRWTGRPVLLLRCCLGLRSGNCWLWGRICSTVFWNYSVIGYIF